MARNFWHAVLKLNRMLSSILPGFERIYRGYYVWEELTPVEKWIGINSNSKVKEKNKKMCSGCNIWRGDTYMNAVQTF